MFGKRPSELTPEDINRVVSEQVQEGSQIEFKGTLPAKGSAADPWVSGKDEVGEFARNKLVEEVIAFANAHGGWLLLGIDETQRPSPPGRAQSCRYATAQSLPSAFVSCAATASSQSSPCWRWQEYRSLGMARA